MKKIPLTQGKVAIVDDEDFEWLSKFKWTILYQKRSRTYVARRSKKVSGNEHSIYMHREILGLILGDKRQCDHRNHDTLDNRRSNIRIATRADNNRNMLITKTSTGYRGVWICPNGRKWRAGLKVNNKNINLGNFDDPRKAAIARDSAALHFHGDFAVINFPELLFNVAL